MACSECDRVWRTYAHATRQHIQALQAQEAAALNRDLAKLTDFEGAVLAAAESRERARQAVNEHEAIHLEKPLGNG
jgi:hypothetical protein